MKKYLEINGHGFEVKKPINAIPVISRRDLSDCYARPSVVKQAIYDNWSRWFVYCNSTQFGVRSYNTNMFTIEGIVEHEGTTYYVYISKTREEIYPIFSKVL